MSDKSETEVRTKKWGVGVELAADHLGPVHFAAIVSRGEDLTLGLHVLPKQHLLHPMLTPEEAKEIRKRVERDVADLMHQAGLAGDHARVELGEDDEIEEGLSDLAKRQGLDALLIGRRARHDEDPIVRLGEVARRVLRRLPVPVIVVPPDFGTGPSLGLRPGPVIFATDLSEHCEEAANFARDLSARLKRPLLLAHGTQAFHWGVSYIPEAAMEQLQTQARAGATHKLEQWARAHGLADARRHVFMGDPVRKVLELAADEDAAMVVSGSRKLGPVERLLLASVSSELAAAASCPVAVVG